MRVLANCHAQVCHAERVAASELTTPEPLVLTAELAYSFPRNGNRWLNQGYAGAAKNLVGAGGAADPVWDPACGMWQFTPNDYFPAIAVAKPLKLLNFWVYLAAEVTAATPFNIVGSTTATDFIGLGNVTGGGTETLSLIDSGAGQLVLSSGTIPAGFHMISVLWTGARYAIYLDGVLRSMTYGGTPITLRATYSLQVGKRASAANYYTGCLGWLIASSVQVAAAQIRALFEQQRHLFGV